jgi:sulfur relay (sulfurtransferase) complex TusBCD TusD component (DsrE family)
MTSPHKHHWKYLRQEFKLTDELVHGQHQKRIVDLYSCEVCLEYRGVDVGPAPATTRGAQPQ